MYSRGNPFAAEHSLVQVTHLLRYLIPMIQFMGP